MARFRARFGMRVPLLGLLGHLLPAALLVAPGARAATVVISEFMADNTRTLFDSDGDASDWIELQNTSSQAVNLAGWRLTDDPARPTQWTLPATNLPAFGYLLIFASGKDRAVAGRELHTNFELDQEGEYLALLQPNGTIAAEFAPSFPAQKEDVGYGKGREVLSRKLVGVGAPARVLVPTSAGLGNTWSGAGANEPFNDSAAAGWIQGPTGVGYEIVGQVDSLRPMGYWNFNSNHATQILDVSGRNHHGTLVGGATYTPDAGGRTGLPGDRALRVSGGARAQIADAAAGVYDSATANNALTVSFWIYGGPTQPAPGSVFWFQQNADGSGARAAQVHLPWNDTVIYWDTSNTGDCCGSSARMFKAEPDSTKWKGRWNHYALVKNGPRKEIWQNGLLFHDAINDYPMSTLRQFTIGSGPAGAAPYDGFIDEFALWDVALSGDQIALLAAGGSPTSVSSLGAFLATDLNAAMRNVSPSAYVRIPFEVTSPVDFDSLLLNIRYDDGFVAYLNGVEIARRNAPALTAFNSSASSDRSRSSAVQVEPIDLPGAAALLRSGNNILAIHGLNDSASSPEFLIWPEVVALRLSGGRYLPQPTPGSANAPGVTGFVDDTSFSANRGFFTAPFDVRITCPTPGATLVFTTNSSVPSLTNGVAVVGSAAEGPVATVRISRTTVLRASAFKADFQPADVDTQTYLFPADIARQPATIPGLPAADYQVDPDVVNTTLPGYSFAEALRAVPTLSLVTEPADMFGATRGIYINSEQRGDSWEKAASVEYFTADGADDYQVNCGVRIHGNISRQNNFTPKHGFGLFFRSRYGSSSFRHPLFPGSDVESFDRLVLKGLSTDTWPCVEWGPTSEGYPRWQRVQASCIRDQWVRDAQLGMGQVSANGRFVQVYLNGLYFGLYNLTEHPDAAFQAAHYGGQEEEYDALKDFAELDSGTYDAWTQAIALANSGLTTEANYQRLQGNNPDGTRNLAYPVLVNVDNLIDYMILHILVGGDDWPYHNWWAARRRGALSEGFKFFAWDQEISNSSLLKMQNAVGVRFELVNDGNTPANFYAACRLNASFRMRFADRVQKHFFNGGALTGEANDARWRARSTEIDQAIVAESARWGDTQRSIPYKREVEWLAHEAWMHTNYWPNINAIALRRYRNVGLYPNVGAPVLSQFGGAIEPGFQLALTHTNTSGLIYFTLDGSDPRLPNGNVAPTALAYSLPITFNSTAAFRTRAKSGADWSALVETVFHAPQDLRGLQVTEIMFHPRSVGTNDGDEFEFLELKNSGTASIDLSDFALTSGVTFTFTNGTRIGPGQFLVLVRNPALFASRYSGVAIHGVYAGKLDNAGETLRLTHPLGGSVLSISYDDQLPWPLTPDLAGFSLVPSQPQSGADPDLPSSWRASRVVDGSPGAEDPPSLVPPIVISELLTHPLAPSLPAIELHNPTAALVDLGGWYLTDDPEVPRKVRIADGTQIPAGGYLKLDGNQVSPISFTAAGGGAYLFSADGGTNLTGYGHGVSFGASDAGVSFGRWVNSVGEEQFPAQSAVTLEAANSGPRVGPIVLSEVHYHPEAIGEPEFVELHNISQASVPLFHANATAGPWRVNGLGYTLSPGLVLEPGGYLVMSSIEPTLFRAQYNVPAGAIVLGPFPGVLQDSGERLELQRPELLDGYGLVYVTVDELRYNDRAPWPPAADGSGPSLQRISLTGPGNDPPNWVAAAPSPGRPFSGGAPPTILTQPADATIVAFRTVTFSVTASGAAPLEYQWRFDGAPLLDETNSTLVLTDVRPEQAGSYSVAVFNPAGTVVSAPAFLTVLMPATITQQPQGQTAQPGATVVFSVTAIGQPPLGYQWHFNGEPISDATNAALVLTNVQADDVGNYHVEVDNGLALATSAAARLTIIAPPIITQSPWNQAVVQGGSVTVSVTVSNTASLPLGYRWRRGGNVVSYQVLNDYVSTFVITNVQSTVFCSVFVTNIAHTSGILSAVATITALTDTDKDGLPDVWENAHGLSPNNAADRALDSDGDRLTNWEEYLAGTDPTDALSYLKVDHLSVAPGGVALEFLAVSNRSYTLISRDSATTGIWRTNATVAAGPADRLISLTNAAPGPKRFYRLATPGP